MPQSQWVLSESEAIESGERAERRAKRSALLCLCDRLARSTRPDVPESALRAAAAACRRVILLAAEVNHAGAEVRAAVSALACIGDPISTRTFNRWAATAVELGVLTRDVRSHRVGRRAWNVWRVDADALRAAARQPPSLAAATKNSTAETRDTLTRHPATTPCHTLPHPDTRADKMSALVSGPKTSGSDDIIKNSPLSKAQEEEISNASEETRSNMLFGQSDLESALVSRGIYPESAAKLASGFSNSQVPRWLVFKALDVFDANRDRWNYPAGVLFRRLSRLRPDDEIGNLATWPQPSAEFLAARAASRREAQTALQLDAGREIRREFATLQTHSAQLEARFGADLDAMDDEARRQVFAAAGCAGRMWAISPSAQREAALEYLAAKGNRK